MRIRFRPRTLLVLLIGALLLTIFPAAPASAGWVYSATTRVQRGGAGTNNRLQFC
jgi:hypothetical protein